MTPLDKGRVIHQVAEWANRHATGRRPRQRFTAEIRSDGAIILLSLSCRSVPIGIGRAVELRALLAAAPDWAGEMARNIREMRRQLREVIRQRAAYGEHRADAWRYGLQLYTTGRAYRREDVAAIYAPTAPGAGDDMADALRYGLEMHRRERDETMGVPSRLLGGRGGGKTTGHLAFTAADSLLGNAPTIGDTLMESAKRRAADFLAHHTDEGIRAGLIALGWTPPPAPGAERRGPAWTCGHCGQCNSGWANQCGRCDGAR